MVLVPIVGSDSQKDFCFYGTRIFSRVDKNPPLYDIQSQFNPIHTITQCFYTV